MYRSNILNNFNRIAPELGIIDDIAYIESFYNAPGRYYHNMEHLDDVLCVLEEYNNDGIFTDREYHIHIITAIYHDIIYNPRASDNEEKSAEFVKHCTCAEDIKLAAINLILFTKYNRNPVNDLEEDFMCADMHIFEEDFTKQLEFEKKIQKEYAWVPLSVYIPERIKVLEKLANLYLGHKDNTCVRPQKLIEYLKNKKWNIGIYAGSFYPMHIGHYDVLKQAEKIFDKVIILQSSNGPKKTNFVWSEYIQKYVGPMNQVLNNFEVHTLNGLITTELDKFKDLGNVTLIRGLRNGSDLLYEQNYIQTLRDIDPNINVTYFLTKPENAHVSSSMVRELLTLDPELALKYLNFPL